MWAQLIRTRTTEGSEADLSRLLQQLRDAEQEASGLLRTVVMREQDDPGSLLMLLVFESEQAARDRESDPRRADALTAARVTMAEVFDGPPTFTDLTVVEEFTP